MWLEDPQPGLWVSVGSAAAAAPSASFSSFQDVKHLLLFYRKSSIIIAADESTISWGPSPTCGELVTMIFVLPELLAVRRTIIN